MACCVFIQLGQDGKDPAWYQVSIEEPNEAEQSIIRFVTERKPVVDVDMQRTIASYMWHVHRASRQRLPDAPPKSTQQQAAIYLYHGVEETLKLAQRLLTRNIFTLWRISWITEGECQHLIRVLDALNDHDSEQPIARDNQKPPPPPSPTNNKDVTCAALMHMATTAIGRAVAENESASNLPEPTHYAIGRLFLSLRARMSDEEQAKVMTAMERNLASM